MDRNKLIDDRPKSLKSVKVSSDQLVEWSTFWKRSLLQRILDLARLYESSYYEKVVFPNYYNRDTICELGCGTGYQLAKISRHYRKIVAIDYSNESLAFTKRTFKKFSIKNYELLEQDIRDIGRIKPKYDIVFSNGLVEHFRNPRIAIESHLNYAKSGGQIIILVPSYYSFKHLWFYLTDNKLLKSFWPWTEQYFFTKSSLVKEVGKVDKKLIGSYHVTVLHAVENIMLSIVKA